MLGCEQAIECTGGRQLAKVRRPFCPDHAVLEASIVCGLSQIRKRSHARAVGTECEYTTLPEELHTIRIGIGIAGCFAVEDVCNVTASFGKRLIVMVRVIATKQNDVSKADLAMLLLKSFHMFDFDKWAFTLRSFVE